MKAELAWEAQAMLGEGAMWHEGRLLWVDIEAGKVCVFDPKGRANLEYPVGQMVGAVVPRKGGGLALALHHGFGTFDPESGEVTILADPQMGDPRTRMNHGACDSEGRFWAGTLNMKTPEPAGALYVLFPDHTWKTVWKGVRCSNGFAWNPEKTRFYYIDTPTRQMRVFDYDAAEVAIANPRVLAEWPAGQGVPDGMTQDAEGNLWVAVWGGGRVVGLDAQTGRELARIDVPARHATSCWFGGAGRDELYITTARTGLDAAALAAEPLAGSLFVARPGVRGAEAYAYAG